jgi:putative holliday junction resolvase
VSRLLGVDYGTKRVGLAVSDALGITARPLEVVRRSEIIGRVIDIAKELDIGKIIVGLPTSLGGEEGSAAGEARKLGEELGKATGLPVEFHDERFTSRMAETSLLESGMKRRDRRETIDKVAAAIILQDYLDRQ